MDINGVKQSAVSGIIKDNPLFIQMLGTCPALATSNSVANGIGMGLSTTVVITFSNLLISLLRRFIPKQIRIASYIVIIAGFVSSLEMVLKAYFHNVYSSLGMYIPLIVVNCLVLARAESFASKNAPIPSVLDGLFMGLGFTFALFLLSSMREILGSGTFAGIPILGTSYIPIMLFVLPPGAFICFGCIVAGFRKVAAKLGS